MSENLTRREQLNAHFNTNFSGDKSPSIRKMSVDSLGTHMSGGEKA